MDIAILLHRHGGPEELVVEPTSPSAPAIGQLRIRNRAVSVNFHDIYVRTGEYRTLDLPGTPGIDAVGEVEAVGDRVAYIEPSYGAYSSVRLLDAGRAYHIPAGPDDVAAAATFLRATTTAMLVHVVHRVRPGDHVLVQAAAGGMGQLLCAWASHLGAVVIGTAGSPEKADIARAAGARHVILYKQDDVAAEVTRLTGGRGVSVVYDSCGRDTFAGSLASLDHLGHLVLFGQSSGPVPPFAPAALAERSLTVSRPILFHYLARPDIAGPLVEKAFAALADGIIASVPSLTLPLARAAEAHRLLEARQSPGAIVLIP